MDAISYIGLFKELGINYSPKLGYQVKENNSLNLEEEFQLIIEKRDIVDAIRSYIPYNGLLSLKKSTYSCRGNMLIDVYYKRYLIGRISGERCKKLCLKLISGRKLGAMIINREFKENQVLLNLEVIELL